MMLRTGIGGLQGTADIKALITVTATRYGVPPALALAVAKQESGYNQSARGAAGEIGVFQLMPGTAAGLGVDPYDLSSNVRGGVTYLSQMIRRYGGDYTKAVEAYNAGPGNVDRGRIPTSTVGYTSNVLAMAGSMDVPDMGASTQVAGSSDPTGTGYGAGSGASGGADASGDGNYTLLPYPDDQGGPDGSNSGLDDTTLLLIAGGALLLVVALNT